jgi:IclR family KDG regulon transcriptional repressor
MRNHFPITRERQKTIYNKKAGAKTLEKGLALLERLAHENGARSLSDLAEATGLPPSTVHRILATLSKFGYVRQDQETRHYQLGSRAVGLAASILQQVDMVQEARALLREFVEQTGEGITLGILEEGEVVVIEKVEASGRPRLFLHIGRRAPAHCTALGKILLAGLADDKIRKLLKQKGMPRYTPNTIVSPAQLLNHLTKVRQQGYAVDDEETALGARCLAVPIRDHLGRVVGAISSSGPKSLWTDSHMEMILSHLRRLSSELSARLGYPSISQYPIVGQM